MKRTTAPYLIQLGNKMGRQFYDSAKPVRERQKAWREFASSVVDAMVFSSELSSGTAKTVFCMSACFYAAKFAGVPVEPKTVKAAEARAKYVAHLDKLADQGHLGATEASAAEASGLSRDRQRAVEDAVAARVAGRFNGKGGMFG